MTKKMIINPDKSTEDAIRNQLRITGGYCPCKPEEIHNPEYKCPCKKFREAFECCCDLYVEA